MDYDLKANVTTVLGFVLLPVLSSFGMDAVTGSAMVGIVSYFVVLLFMYLNERYLSKIFTKEGYSVVRDSDVCTCPTTEEESINQEYVIDSEAIKESSDVDSDEGA